MKMLLRYLRLLYRHWRAFRKFLHNIRENNPEGIDPDYLGDWTVGDKR